MNGMEWNGDRKKRVVEFNFQQNEGPYADRRIKQNGMEQRTEREILQNMKS